MAKDVRSASAEETRSFTAHVPTASLRGPPDDWCAQSHPDEDFAETFAVWLTPGFHRRERYKDWKALQKLDTSTNWIPSPASADASRNIASPTDCLGVRLKTHYAQTKALRGHVSDFATTT
jgi:hypothetical protein